MDWINVEDERPPLETDIIVKHKYGVEAIHFFSGKWTYWYSNTPVETSVLQSITHWCDPKK